MLKRLWGYFKVRIPYYKKAIGTAIAGISAGAVITAAQELGIEVSEPVAGLIVLAVGTLGTLLAPKNVVD